MKLKKLLSQKRSIILKRWLDCILETYPADTKRFLKKQSDRFANPVGSTISRETEELYLELLDERDIDPGRVSPILDRIIRIRAVQEFTPSEAVAFVFQLKTVIRGVVDRQTGEAGKGDDLADLESRIDRVALLAFEKYTECREKLHEVRNDAIKSRTMKLLERVNGISAIPQHQEEPIDDDA